jgi:hypothetical protein
MPALRRGGMAGTACGGEAEGSGQGEAAVTETRPNRTLRTAYHPVEPRECPYCGDLYQPRHRKQAHCPKRQCQTRHMHAVAAGKAARVRDVKRGRS